MNKDKELEYKREIQELRTELNTLKKCIKGISYDIDHMNKEPYDYGEASEHVLEQIQDRINGIQ